MKFTKERSELLKKEHLVSTVANISLGMSRDLS